MSFADKMKEIFTNTDNEEGKHAVEDGANKDWSAAEFDESYYVDDDWIRENTKEV